LHEQIREVEVRFPLKGLNGVQRVMAVLKTLSAFSGDLSRVPAGGTNFLYSVLLS
jgi:hypothetical protein